MSVLLVLGHDGLSLRSSRVNSPFSMVYRYAYSIPAFQLPVVNPVNASRDFTLQKKDLLDYPVYVSCGTIDNQLVLR
jgi:hypothetical protein